MFSDFEIMSANLANADVVFVGEQHDDPNTHRLELAVLEALARRGRDVIVSLEMFERDAQEPLEHFLMGHMTEEEFSRCHGRGRGTRRTTSRSSISRSRRLAGDCPNVPRPIASEVSKGGWKSSRRRATPTRSSSRPSSSADDDEYFKRFSGVMGGHPVPGQAAEEARRTTSATTSPVRQDETMPSHRAGLHGRPHRRQAPHRRALQRRIHSDYGRDGGAR